MSRNANGAYTLPAGVATSPYLTDAQIQVALADLGGEMGNSPRASQLADLSGTAITTGSGLLVQAYALTLATPWTTLPIGLPFMFRAHAANGSPCTMTVNGIGPFPIRPASGADLPVAALVPGAVYMAALNLGSFAQNVQGTLTPGQTQITGIFASNLQGVVPGQLILGTGIAPGTYITNVTVSGSSSTLTMSSPYTGGQVISNAIVQVLGAEVLLAASATDYPYAGAAGVTLTGNATQTGGFGIQADTVEVTGATNTNNSAVLPARVGNLVIINASAVTINVYPPLNGRLNGGAVNAGVTIAAGAKALFASADGLKWYV